jgi:hypothetical protein
MKTDQELLDKWKPILDYTSEYFDETPEYCRKYVAKKLEDWEEKCLEWCESGKADDYYNNTSLAKILIPQIRASLGEPDIELDVKIDGRLCLIVNNGKIRKYNGKIGIPYKMERDVSCHHNHDDIYFMIDGEWVSSYETNI